MSYWGDFLAESRKKLGIDTPEAAVGTIGKVGSSLITKKPAQPSPIESELAAREEAAAAEPMRPELKYALIAGAVLVGVYLIRGK